MALIFCVVIFVESLLKVLYFWREEESSNYCSALFSRHSFEGVVQKYTVTTVFFTLMFSSSPSIAMSSEYRYNRGSHKPFSGNDTVYKTE